jgi:hypothetical protein
MHQFILSTQLLTRELQLLDRDQVRPAGGIRLCREHLGQLLGHLGEHQSVHLRAHALRV